MIRTMRSQRLLPSRWPMMPHRFAIVVSSVYKMYSKRYETPISAQASLFWHRKKRDKSGKVGLRPVLPSISEARSFEKKDKAPGKGVPPEGAYPLSGTALCTIPARSAASAAARKDRQYHASNITSYTGQIYYTSYRPFLPETGEDFHRNQQSHAGGAQSAVLSRY